MTEEKSILLEISEIKKSIGELNAKIDTLIPGEKQPLELPLNPSYAYTEPEKIRRLSPEELKENRIRLMKRITEDFANHEYVIWEELQWNIAALLETVEQEKSDDAIVQLDSFMDWYETISSKHEIITIKELRERDKQQLRKEKMRNRLLVGFGIIAVTALLIWFVQPLLSAGV